MTDGEMDVVIPPAGDGSEAAAGLVTGIDDATSPPRGIAVGVAVSFPRGSASGWAGWAVPELFMAGPVNGEGVLAASTVSICVTAR